jgi:hypothetical protein
MADYADDPAFRAWQKRVREDLVPKLRDSAVVMSLVPTGPTDIKFAVELGLSIMMDKPILAVVAPGTKVPDKLVRVADRIIEGDIATEAGRVKLQAALTAYLEGTS